MTQVREQGQRQGNPYLNVLSRPGALRFSAAAFVGRMPMSMFGLGTLLLIASVTGRYGLAGFVAAAGSVGYAVCAPQAARLADRFGQRRVLRPLTVLFAAATAGLIGSALGRAPVWAMVVTGGLAGAAMPSIGSMVRARWSALLGDSPLLHTAFALESVADETIFVIGPALVTVLATEVYPAAGVAVAMVACVTGTLLFAAQRGTEPPAGRAQPHAGAAGPLAGTAGPQAAAGPGRGGRGARLPAPGLVTLVTVPLRKPVNGEIDLSSTFGVRVDPFLHVAAMHTGLDFRGDAGDPIHATAAGTVVGAGWSGGYGRMVEIDHGNGLSTRYGHLSQIDVKVGDEIRIGQVIGRMGSTGRSTGPHLHYETRIDGDPVDPQKFLHAGARLAGASSDW